MDFDGTEWIDLRAGGAVIDAVNGAPAGTIMGWFRLDNEANDDLYGYSINNGGTPNSDSRLGLDRAAGPHRLRQEWAAPDTATNSASPYTIPALGTYHFASRINVAGDRKTAFVDGVQVADSAEAFTPTTFDATGSASGGIMAEPDGDGDESDGAAADCRVYARALSDDEIATIYVCNGHDGIWYGCRGRYKLNEGAPGVTGGAGSCKDMTVNARHGSPVGTPTYIEDPRSYRRRFP